MYSALTAGLLSLFVVACEVSEATENLKEKETKKVNVEQPRNNQPPQDSIIDKMQLIYLKSELLNAETTLESIKEFKLGRELAEEERQTLKQQQKIDTLRKKIEALEEKMK